MDTLRQDLRFALRTFRRSPAFALTAIAAAALGIGANTAIFGMADALIFRPAPFQEADRLAVFWEENRTQGARFNEVAPIGVHAVRERARSFERIAAYDFRGAVLTGDGQPERLRGLVIDDALLPLLAVQPALGRAFSPADTRPGAAPVALISHGLWQRRFGARPDVVGRSITLDGAAVTVIGVLPRAFQFAAAADVYRPLALSATAWQEQDRWLRTVARLRPDVSLRAAARELDVIAHALEREHPASRAGWRFSIHHLNDGLLQGPVRPLVSVLLAAVGFVLLIACADIANLLLVRASGRARELAIRGALGASRARLARQLLTESLLLALAGGAAGSILAAWSLELVRTALPARTFEFSPRLATLGVDARALAFTAAATLVTGLAFGLLPALRAARADLGPALEHGQRSGTGRRGGRIRAALVGLQVALAVVLLACGSLTMRSFLAQNAAHGAALTEHMLALWVSPRSDTYDSPERIRAFHRQVLDRVVALPGIADAALTSAYPLSGEEFRPGFTLEGRPPVPGAERPTASTRMISEAYLRLLRVPLLEGRELAGTDREDAPPVAIVSRSFARRFFTGETAIGRRITLDDDETRTIVGVVADVQDWRTGTTSMATVYVPLAQFPARTVAIVARTSTEPARAAQDIRAAVYTIDPRLPVYNARTMREVLDEALFSERLSAALMSVFALVALLLATVGVYGVMAHAVSHRRHELGVRMALGARAADIIRQVVTPGMRPVLIGIGAGLAGAFFATRLLGAVLWGARGLAAASVVLAALLLAAAALAALALPAWRAARLDPVAALRAP